MTNIGLPVTPGVVITHEACTNTNRLGKVFPERHGRAARENLAKVGEKAVGKVFGAAQKPLLVSVVPGPVSMPGLMDTILNLGLNDQTLKGYDRRTNNDGSRWTATRLSDVRSMWCWVLEHSASK
jgi:pyruvate,orthophosphate dikinase